MLLIAQQYMPQQFVWMQPNWGWLFLGSVVGMILLAAVKRT
jgi:hypothetical protein